MDSQQDQLNKQPEIITRILEDDGQFPNNEDYPVIIYRQVINFTDHDGAEILEDIFGQNGWSGSWRDGIFSYHHYHSNTQEVLGIYCGEASVQFGGPHGQTFKVKRGDVILLPAGIAHKNLGSSSDFRVVGAYPGGRSYDMNYGKEGERPAADGNIKKVPVPQNDPVFGNQGPVTEYWGQ